MDKFRSALKTILSKLPVFIFCVLFIKGHDYLFGEENSIMAVTLLIGIFVLLANDLGFKTRQAAASIPFLYLIIAFAPKLASINPYSGIVINFVSIAIILIISGYKPDTPAYVPFMMGYIFSQGYDVSGETFKLKVISLVCGGVLIALMYLLVHKKDEQRQGFAALFRSLDLHSKQTQWFLRLAVTLTLVMFLGDLFDVPRTMWISLAVLSLTTPEQAEHYSRAKVRIPAAILGTAIFYILFVKLVPADYQAYIIMAAGFASMFMSNYFVKSIYNSFSAMGAALLLFTAEEAIFIRVLGNIVGTVVALISYKLFSMAFDKFTREGALEDCENALDPM